MHVFNKGSLCKYAFNKAFCKLKIKLYSHQKDAEKYGNREFIEKETQMTKKLGEANWLIGSQKACE